MSGVAPNIHHVGDVDSTMEVARAMLAAAKGAPFAVLAESQSKGRGTGGRVWTSPKGNLYFTLCIPEASIRAEIVPVLPLVTGLACRAAIMSIVSGANFYVKWPNDIVYNGKKLGGSIVESEGGYLLVGIGMNVEVAPPVTDNGRDSTTVNYAAAAVGQPNITALQLAGAVWKQYFEIISDTTVSRKAVVENFEAAMDKNLILHRRTPTGRDPEPLRAVRLNEWGHLTVLKPDSTEETLMAEYLF
ncbi:biotin/lipoate protein ligase [Trypanosoma rangeli]|uniref:Biotin/lipoate protein ligase n=1 Tax=Trypanosoma rangeli TaxID=5698 RepID=A0A3R7NY08_TRYRA|nr:biotin/lipoate protein ligase [Trypanosoma rangeli]RNF09499.1 biotin/lipoate protein ligase [Trypanosoma rangeli]|eukprot:RNF09499.1 biotin/lipoate protein ligase [Trypanosoma rangeli]